MYMATKLGVLLPFCHLVLQAQKPGPKAYPDSPKTMGEHIRKRRMDLHLTRKGLGEILAVSPYSIKEWEEGNASPRVSLVPQVISFLGYKPFGDPGTMSEGEKIRQSRRMLGLTREEAAERLGVCTSTLACWENGRGVKKQVYLVGIERLIVSASRVAATAQSSGPQETAALPILGTP